MTGGFSSTAVRLPARRTLVAAVIVFCSLHPANSAPPAINRLQPAAAVPGIETPLQLVGDNLGGPSRIWTSFPCGGSLEREQDDSAFKIKLPPQTKPGVGAIRVITTNGMSGLNLLLVDPVPSIVASNTNQTLATAQPLTRRSAVDGVCEELSSAFYRISAKKGERIALEVVAQRLGSPLDPLLRVLDATGRELAAVDDSPGLRADARLEFRAPKAGDYFVEVRDTRYSGSPRHRYRLRVAEPLPVPLPFLGSSDFDRFTAPLNPPPAATERETNDSQPQNINPPVEVSGSFAAPGDRDWFAFQAGKGERLLFSGRTRSLGSPCDLFLQIQTTNGTKVAESNPTEADEGMLTNRFTEAATYHLVVEELNRLGGPGFEYEVSILPLEPGFELSVEAEQYSAPAGDSIEIAVQAQRRDYDGPITLKVLGLGSDFAATNLIISAKTNATKVKVTIPGDLDLSEFHPFALSGSAKIDGSIFTTRVSTFPALRAAFPGMRFPPAELDGLMSLSVSESKTATPKPARRKRK